jgi:hypothetical protein
VEWLLGAFEGVLARYTGETYLQTHHEHAASDGGLQKGLRLANQILDRQQPIYQKNHESIDCSLIYSLIKLSVPILVLPKKALASFLLTWYCSCAFYRDVPNTGAS